MRLHPGLWSKDQASLQSLLRFRTKSNFVLFKNTYFTVHPLSKYKNDLNIFTQCQVFSVMQCHFSSLEISEQYWDTCIYLLRPTLSRPCLRTSYICTAQRSSAITDTRAENKNMLRYEPLMVMTMAHREHRKLAYWLLVGLKGCLLACLWWKHTHTHMHRHMLWGPCKIQRSRQRHRKGSTVDFLCRYSHLQ